MSSMKTVINMKSVRFFIYVTALFCLNDITYDSTLDGTINQEILVSNCRRVKQTQRADFLSQAYSEGRVSDISSHEKGSQFLEEAVEFLEFTRAFRAKKYLMELVAEGKVKFVELELDTSKMTEDIFIITRNALKKNLSQRSVSDGMIYISDMFFQPARSLIEQLGVMLNLDVRVIQNISSMFFDWQHVKRSNNIADRFSQPLQDVNRNLLVSIRNNGLMASFLEEDGLEGVLIKREMEIPIALYWGLYAVLPVMAERPWVSSFDLYFADYETVQRRLKNTIVCVAVDDGTLQLTRTNIFPDYTDFDWETGEVFNQPVDFDSFENYDEIPFDRDMTFRPISFEHHVWGGGIPFKKIEYVLVPEELYNLASGIFPQDKIITVGYKKEKIHFTLRDGDAVYTLPNEQSRTFVVPDYEAAIANLLRETGKNLFVHGVKLYDDADSSMMVQYMRKQSGKFLEFMKKKQFFLPGTTILVNTDSVLPEYIEQIKDKTSEAMKIIQVVWPEIYKGRLLATDEIRFDSTLTAGAQPFNVSGRRITNIGLNIDSASKEVVLAVWRISDYIIHENAHHLFSGDYKDGAGLFQGGEEDKTMKLIHAWYPLAEEICRVKGYTHFSEIYAHMESAEFLLNMYQRIKSGDIAINSSETIKIYAKIDNEISNLSKAITLLVENFRLSEKGVVLLKELNKRLEQLECEFGKIIR